MKAHYTMQSREKDELQVGPVSRQLRICVACGNIYVEEYEFGISCERCGTSFYFGNIHHEEVN